MTRKISADLPAFETDAAGKGMTDPGLFFNEEEVLAESEQMLRHLDEVASGVRNLAGAYRQAYKEQAKLVRVSDRMQLELHGINHRLSQEVEERRRLAEDLAAHKAELQKSNEELKKLNDQKDRFFSIIAHDLRSPFTGLVGVAEMLSSDAEKFSYDEIKEFGDLFRQASRQSLDLVENLLEWARMQMGRFEAEIKALCLGHVVTAALAPLRAIAAQKGITISSRVGGSTQPDSAKSEAKSEDGSEEVELPILVLADQGALQTALRNLVANGIKFTPKGGEVTISAQPLGTAVVISVADSGIGIDPDILPHLFDVSVKTTTTGTSGEPGTGLGLPLVKELLAHSGGSISVTSTPPEGTRFTIVLPAPGPE